MSGNSSFEYQSGPRLTNTAKVLFYRNKLISLINPKPIYLELSQPIGFIRPWKNKRNIIESN